MRKVLADAQIAPSARATIDGFHQKIVADAQAAVENNEWVIIGMRQNPVVKNAREFLKAKGVQFHYVEHGSYFSMWKERLAIKLWSGWPTFPQIFHKGRLIGGFDDLKKHLSGVSQ